MRRPDLARLDAVLAAVDREGVTMGDEARFEEAFNYETLRDLLDLVRRGDEAEQKVATAIAVLNDWWRYDDWPPLLGAVRDVLESGGPAHA